MALIECADCGKQVSDTAAACIHCGRPLRDTPATGTPMGTFDAPVLIEASSRRYKRNMLVGIGCIPLGLLIMFVAGAANSVNLIACGVIVIFGGVVWFLLNAVARWYHHA